MDEKWIEIDKKWRKIDENSKKDLEKRKYIRKWKIFYKVFIPLVLDSDFEPGFPILSFIEI